MCTIKYMSYDDYACDNGFYPLFDEISGKETRAELVKIINREYDLENINNMETMFDHLKEIPNVQIYACYKTLGNCYVDLLQYENAIKAFTLAEKYGSKSALARLADVYCLQKNKEKAVEILMPLVDEQNPHACCQYSHMLFNEKKYDDAEKYAIIAIMAGDVIATQVLGHIYITTKQFDKIQEYEKYIKIAVDKENEHLDALYNGNKFLCHFMILGRMYHLAGNITKAIEMYDSITDPYEITIFIEKAMLYLQNNEENKAYEQLDLFEENDGFKKLKSKMYKSKGNIKEMIVLIQLQRYYALNNIDKFLQYLFICSPKEQASVIRKLKLSQIID